MRERGGEWTKTYTGKEFRPEAAGRLMTYESHGVLAVNISLQCGNPGYDREAPEIKRVIAAKEGAGKGFLCGAFLPDGSMKLFDSTIVHADPTIIQGSSKRESEQSSCFRTSRRRVRS